MALARSCAKAARKCAQSPSPCSYIQAATCRSQSSEMLAPVCWPSPSLKMARSAHKASAIAQVRSWPYRQSSWSLSFKFDLAFWLDKIAFKFKRLVFALKNDLV